jgi:hypothetical protein
VRVLTHSSSSRAPELPVDSDRLSVEAADRIARLVATCA